MLVGELASVQIAVAYCSLPPLSYQLHDHGEVVRVRELSVADCGAQFADCLCVLRVRSLTCSAAVYFTADS